MSSVAIWAESALLLRDGIMELTTYFKCACANCGEVMEYRSSEAGQAVECPQCKEKSLLPEPEKLTVIETLGPPAPKAKNCAVCGTQMNFWTVQCPACESLRKKRQVFIQVMAYLPAVILLAGLVLLARHLDKNVLFVRAKTQPDPVKIQTEIGKATLPPPHILIEQPRPRTPKSTNDLRAGTFALERRRGSDLVIAVGDIENISDNLHGQLKADVDVLDQSGVKIGEVRDFVTFLGPHQHWRFLGRVAETNAFSLRLAGLTEE